MNTSYDDIYTEFITNTKTDDINLPNSQEKTYDSIHSAIRHYNNRLRDNLNFDDDNENVDRSLNNDELLLIAHYLRISFLKNQKSEFVTTWSPFEKDIGIKNYQSQVKALQETINEEESTIEKIIFNSMTSI